MKDSHPVSKQERLERLLKNPGLWRAGHSRDGHDTLPTGFRVLDQALSGGWPAGALTELLVEHYGVGELRIVIPALAALSQGRGGKPSATDRWIMLVSPPYIPYVPALEYRGVDIARLLLVRSRHHDDTCWAMEQAVRSGACAAVLGWTAGGDDRSLRRLQLAAEAGNCWTVLFRPVAARQWRSPAALRIHLRAHRGEGLCLGVLRNRYGRPGRVILDA